MAAHVLLEEGGERYEPIRLDLAKGEQRSEAYLKLNPLGRVPVLRLDDGAPVSENTAILPYLGKRFGLWASDALGEAKLLSLIGYFAAAVHPAFAHVSRPERYSDDPSDFPALRDKGLNAWGARRELPVGEFKNYTAFKDRMLQRPAVRRALDDEQIKV